MRITSEMMVHRSLDRLQSRLAQYERSHSELSTGKRILNPSDDPAGARRSMSLRASMQAREQEQKNIDDARGWLDAADTQLQTVVERLSRVRDLATAGASEGDANAKKALAAEIRQITEEIAGIANTRHLDRPLFGGFGSESPVSGNATDGWTVSTDDGQVTRRVSDSETVQVNVTAAEWLADAGTGEDLLSFLGRIATDLESGAPGSQISGHLGTLTGATEAVTDGLSKIGAATNRIESARARSVDLGLTLRNELSSVEDVDLAQGIMELQIQQVAYEATLQALGKSLPPSLVAFLR